MKGYKVPIGLAILWFAQFVFLHKLNLANIIKIGALTNILFVLSVCVWAIYSDIKESKAYLGYVHHFKNVFKNGAVYVMLAIGMFHVYNKYVDSSFFNDRRAQRVAFETKHLPESESDYTGVIEGFTRQEAVDLIKERSEMIGGTGMFSSLYFFGMLALTLFYSILIPIGYKKLVLRM